MYKSVIVTLSKIPTEDSLKRCFLRISKKLDCEGRSHSPTETISDDTSDYAPYIFVLSVGDSHTTKGTKMIGT